MYLIFDPILFTFMAFAAFLVLGKLGAFEALFPPHTIIKQYKIKKSVFSNPFLYLCSDYFSVLTECCKNIE